MPGGVLPYQSEYISSELRDYLASFDVRIGTLEAAIGTDYPYDPVKIAGRQNIVYARDEDFFRVKEMDINLVSLANNHVMDLTDAGLTNTIRLVKENGMKYCGAGLNIEEASKPAILDINGERIAILAYCMYGNKYLGHVELASKDKAGVNPLDIDTAICDIRDNKKKYDRVIVMPHWGREYKFHPLQECITMAKQMINAGADAVLGSHTHQIQPCLKYKGKPICFSMGNFLFPDFYMRPPRPIWYPTKEEDLASIKDVVGYPFPIEEPIRQVWNPISRYGCMVALEFNGKHCITSIKYVHMSDSNVTSLCELPASMKRSILYARLSIESLAFRYIRKMRYSLFRNL